MGIRRGPNIVRDGLVFAVDAANPTSFVSGSGVIWKDQTVNQNDGTLTNGPVFDSDGGGSIDFDGSDDYCNINNNLGITNYPFSISSWVKFNSNTNIGFGSISNSSTTNQIIGFGVVFDSGVLKPRFIILNGSTNIKTGTTALSTDVWYNICQVYSSNTSKFYYINGEIEMDWTDNITFPTGVNRFTLASYGDSTPAYWDCKISNFQVYNQSLSASEVLQNYNALKGRFGL
jgi:hypothetical protein